MERLKDEKGRFINQNRIIVSKCLICNKEIEHYISRKGKYCSLKCKSKSLIGKESWCKGTKGIMKPNKTSFKKGNQHVGWKGGVETYTNLHKFINDEKGKAKNYKCVMCNNQAMDWSNIDHRYSRNLEDYRPMCRSCHMKWDYQFNNWRNDKQWRAYEELKNNI